MKTLDLNAYGVQEMNQQEMMETDGGAAWLAAVGAAIAAVASSPVVVVAVAIIGGAIVTDMVMNVPETTKVATQGLKDGFNSIKK